MSWVAAGDIWGSGCSGEKFVGLLICLTLYPHMKAEAVRVKLYLKTRGCKAYIQALHSLTSESSFQYRINQH
jgi:hypothetical protein